MEECSGEEGDKEVVVGKTIYLADLTLNSMNSWILTNIVNLLEGECYECKVCQVVLKNKYNMKDHINIVHTPRQPPLKCTKDFCQKTFVTKYQLEQHRVRCSFTCSNCGRTIKKCGRVVGHLKRCTGLL